MSGDPEGSKKETFFEVYWTKLMMYLRGNHEVRCETHQLYTHIYLIILTQGLEL
jgi:LSD1 subclass zinc finger protein